MRIIGGNGKGKRLNCPRSVSIRPTTDQVKEAVFNILPPLYGKSFLDLFAGSGGVGIEALSRGAAFVCFIEKNADHARIIKRNIQECGFINRYEILAMEVMKGIKKMQMKELRFDFIFLDPPYDNGLIYKTLESIMHGNLLLAAGEVIVQRSLREEMNLDKLDFLLQTDERKYGDTILSFFKLNQGLSL